MSQFHRRDGEQAGTYGVPAVLVVPTWHGQGIARDGEARAEELQGLARAIALDVRATEAIRIRQPRAGTLFGSGQVQDLGASVQQNEAELVVVDARLTAIQQRNLETALGTKVIDRTALILEIFGERASTAEGRLQVELAHLDYQAGRLVRSWTHLERQRGGFGFLGGPGETQIEADRRMIRDRMARIRRQLEEVKRTRALQRRKRQRAPWPTVALVGYTNAGKSTLFNALTDSRVMAEDLLFATLDPAMRAMRLPGFNKVILSDTVGFVSDLPTELVAAFRATLEEVLAADLILHVRDIAHPDTAEQRADVRAILQSLGVTSLGGEGDNVPKEHDSPDGPRVVEVWNKIDALDAERAEEIRAKAARHDDIIAVSAFAEDDIAALRSWIARQLSTADLLRTFVIPVGGGDALAWLHAHGFVEREDVADDGAVTLDVRLSALDAGRFAKAFAVTEQTPGA